MSSEELKPKRKTKPSAKATAKYHKEKTVSITFRIMKNTEPDIIEKLESVPNKAGYIKSLIRADIEKSK